MICETTSYESRIYAYENDVMFYNLVPAFYGQMGRLYINASLQLTDKIELFVKVARSFQAVGGGWGTRCQLVCSL
jgi:hypothetical protein